MYGVVTRNAEELGWPEFDPAFYEVKSATGEFTDPEPNGVATLSCFGDTATAETQLDVAARDEAGRPATREREGFDWGYVCPCEEPYREGLLETIADCASVSGDVRLDEVGFPRASFCHCERCERAFAESDADDWESWRASVVTEFVAEAAERVPGDLYLSLYPDPYPGHLRRREGVDVDALSKHVDEFVVPLYDTTYETTYWVETLAAGFADALERPFSVELYAVGVDVDALADAATLVGEHADGVVFGYEASNGRAVVRRLGAEGREGRTFRPD